MEVKSRSVRVYQSGVQGGTTGPPHSTLTGLKGAWRVRICQESSVAPRLEQHWLHSWSYYCLLGVQTRGIQWKANPCAGRPRADSQMGDKKVPQQDGKLTIDAGPGSLLSSYCSSVVQWSFQLRSNLIHRTHNRRFKSVSFCFFKRHFSIQLEFQCIGYSYIPSGISR